MKNGTKALLIVEAALRADAVKKTDAALTHWKVAIMPVWMIKVTDRRLGLRGGTTVLLMTEMIPSTVASLIEGAADHPKYQRVPQMGDITRVDVVKNINAVTA